MAVSPTSGASDRTKIAAIAHSATLAASAERTLQRPNAAPQSRPAPQPSPPQAATGPLAPARFYSPGAESVGQRTVRASLGGGGDLPAWGLRATTTSPPSLARHL